MSDLRTRPLELVRGALLPAIAELSGLDQWVISKYVEGRDKAGNLRYNDDGTVKLDKPPFSPHTKRQCSHSDPAHWSSYATARRALPGFDWLGFVFHPADPYSGVDLDGCRDKASGAIAPWAQRWIDALDSYTEISPSGEGVKVFVRGTLPATLTHPMGAHIGIEVYSQQRYFTVTHQHLAGTPTTIQDAQTALDQMWAEYHQEKAPAPARPIVKVSPGEAAAGRLSARDTIDQANRNHDLGQLLESHGAQLVRERGDKRYYSGLHGDQHTHDYTFIISAARDGNGQIGFCYSSGGTLNKGDYPRGFRWFDAYVTLEQGGNVTTALKALSGRTHANPAPVRNLPDYLTPAEAERRRQDAARKRSARHQMAAETRAEVRARAADDATLRASDRAVLDALLTIAGDKSWCRPSKERIAEVSRLGLGTVKRALFSAAKGGRLEGRYFTSQGDGGGPNTTAIRTFLRGSIWAQLIPMLDLDSDSESDSRICEGGVADPAEVLERLSFASYLRNLAGELGELLDLAELTALEQAELEALEAQLLQRLADGAPGEDSQVENRDAAPGGDSQLENLGDAGACYIPALDWTSGGRLDLAGWRDPLELRLLELGSVDDQSESGELLDLAPEPEPEPLIRSAPTEPAAAREYWALKHKKPVNFKQASWIRHRLAALEIWVPASQALALEPPPTPALATRQPRRRAAAPSKPEMISDSGAADQLQLELPIGQLSIGKPEMISGLSPGARAAEAIGAYRRPARRPPSQAPVGGSQ